VAQALILDAEALSALAFATERSVLTRRARAILGVAYDEGALVRVPAPVLAEVCRGGARDAAVLRVLNGRGIEVVGLTAAMGRTAGGLLHKAKLGSAHAVDAFVVATAVAFGSAVIATHDPDDLRRLATGLRGIRIFAV
jgi:predicted nucleic acid-binding protein